MSDDKPLPPREPFIITALRHAQGLREIADECAAKVIAGVDMGAADGDKTVRLYCTNKDGEMVYLGAVGEEKKPTRYSTTEYINGKWRRVVHDEFGSTIADTWIRLSDLPDYQHSPIVAPRLLVLPDNLPPPREPSAVEMIIAGQRAGKHSKGRKRKKR